MFEPENQFYPTPKAIAEKMLAPHIKTYDGEYSDVQALKVMLPICDPSAGKGDLLDAILKIRGDRNSRKDEYLAIEIDPELRMILNEKGYKVIGSDFLLYDEPLEFGFIIMNPPFNEGDKHILKAWQHLKEGGNLVALINSETVRNVCAKTRELLKSIIDAHGTVEEIGSCFKDADRPTDVEISIVRLVKPVCDRDPIEFESSKFKRDYVTEEEFSANPLAHSNYLVSLVAQYKSAERLIVERQKLGKQLDFYLQGLSQTYTEDKIHKISEISLEEQISSLKGRFWQTVFSKSRIGGQLTGKFSRDFEDFRREQKNMAFSVENIQEVLLMFFGNYNEIMLGCLLEVFDKLTAFHEDNKIHVEGWKTNKGYKLNPKVIYPYGVSHDPRWGGSWSCHRSSVILSDIDTVLCWLEGKKPDQIIRGTYCALQNHIDSTRRNNSVYSEKFYSDYFEMRMYKKGTLHLTFRDKELLNSFNIKAAQGKKWIGGEGF